MIIGRNYYLLPCSKVELGYILGLSYFGRTVAAFDSFSLHMRHSAVGQRAGVQATYLHCTARL